MVFSRRQKASIFEHPCRLDEDPHEFNPEIRPFAPLWMRIKRYLKMALVLSEDTPRVRMYYLSRAAILKDQKAQFYSKRTRYVIHPFSRIARYREGFMPVVWIATLVMQPFLATFFFYMVKLQSITAVEKASELKVWDVFHDYFQWVVSALILLDMFFNFRLGYCVPNRRIIVMDRGAIALYYLKTYFVCDLMCIAEGIASFFFPHLKDEQKLLVYQLIWFRVPRAISMVTYIEEHLRKYGVGDAKILLSKLFISTVLIIHWLACLLILIPTYDLLNGNTIEMSWLYQMHTAQIQNNYKFVYAIYPTVTLFVLVHFFGMGSKLHSTDRREHVLLSLILILGLFYYLVVSAKLLQFFGISNIAEAKYDEFCHTIHDYTVVKKFPPELGARLHLYYEHKFRKKLFWENTILSNLSQHLRFEVILHNCSNLIHRVVIFRNLPKSTVGAILANLTPEVYLPNDLILSHDDITDTIFFITFGTVSCVVVESGREMFHLEDGNHFGNVHSYMRQAGTHPYFDMIAAETTEVYTIDRRVVKQCLANLTEFANVLEDSAAIRIGTYEKCYAKDRRRTRHEDVLTELSKKHILMAPNKRGLLEG